MTLPLPANWVTGNSFSATAEDAVEAAVNALGAGTLIIPQSVNVSSASSLTLGTSTYNTYVYSGSAATTWTLPAVSGNTNARLQIENRGTTAAAAISLVPAGSDHIWFKSSVSAMTVAAGGSLTLVNDGTYWNALSLDLANNSVGVLPVANGGSGSATPLFLSVNAYGADPTGATDSTTAFAAAQTAGGSNPYVLVLGTGTYKLGTSANLTTFGQFQGMVGQGSGATTINYVGSATCVYAYNASYTSSSTGGVFGGYTINGSGASAGAIGMSVGNLNTLRGHDIRIVNFSGTGSIGLQFKNGTSPAGNSEQSEWTAIYVGFNTTNVVFDTGSFDYSVYQFLLQANANQTGVTLQNSVNLAGVRLEIRGNFNGGSTNSGYVLGIDAGGGGVGSSFIDNAFAFINVEADGTSGQTGHKTIVMGGANTSRFTGMGVLSFEGSTVTFQGASIGSGPTLGFNGIINDPVLGQSANDSLSVQGGSSWEQFGATTSLAYTGMYIYPQFGDFQAYGVPTYSITVAGVANTYLRSKRLLLLFKQPATGTGVTPTWPGAWVWAHGNSTLSTANNAVDLIELTYFPSESLWYANIIYTTTTAYVSLTANVTGTLPVGNGGTGAATLTGLVKGNGTSAMTAVTAPSGTVVGASDAQTLTNKTLTGPLITSDASPSYASGKLVFDSANDCLTFFNSDSSVSLQIGQEDWLRAVNNTGSNITNGAAVYVSGASSGAPTIALAKANALSTCAFGIATEAIANGATGIVTLYGMVHNLNTSGFSAGATVYLDSATAGNLVSTSPTGLNYSQMLGTVLVSSSTVGIIVVNPRTPTGPLVSPTITGAITEGFYSIGTVTTSYTIALSNGTMQTCTLTNGSTCAFTMPTAVAGESFTLIVKQPATTGSGVATFGSPAKWPSAGTPTMTTGGGKSDIFTFLSDGTDWFGGYSQGYTY